MLAIFVVLLFSYCASSPFNFHPSFHRSTVPQRSAITRQNMPTNTPISLPKPQPSGKDIVGREILVCWDDGVWYDAVVVRYFESSDEYKLVYRADDGIEIAPLRNRRWLLAPKKKCRPNRPILDGAIVSFIYPSDGQRYSAMVYDYSHGGERLKIAYLDEHSTDNLKGCGWDFLSTSPCADDAGAADHNLYPNGASRQMDNHVSSRSPRKISKSRRSSRTSRKVLSDGITKRPRRNATESLL